MYKDISRLLSQWYEINKRDLPWRRTRDPYIIWISEVILQQTRVDQGYAYYERFVSKFPDVQSLAQAEEDEVLKLWQGLGYYSRARNLHAAAKDVVERFGGTFPHNHKDVLSLKGVGDYTAAAIVSFAYDQPYSVVDGNVFRVLSRLLAIDEPIDTGKGKKLFSELAQEVLDKADPATHNQAIMELGALQCVPHNPICENCPIMESCLAFAKNEVSKYPIKQGKVKTKARYFNYLDVRCGEYTYINKRTGDDIWKNLYELPLIETEIEVSLEDLLGNTQFRELFGDTKLDIKLVKQFKHVLSHRIIYAYFYQIELSEDSLAQKGFTKIRFNEMDDYPVSRLVHKYLETQG